MRCLTRGAFRHIVVTPVLDEGDIEATGLQKLSGSVRLAPDPLSLPSGGEFGLARGQDRFGSPRKFVPGRHMADRMEFRPERAPTSTYPAINKKPLDWIRRNRYTETPRY